MGKIDHYDKFFWQPGDVEIYTPEDAKPINWDEAEVEELDENSEDYEWETDDEESDFVRSRSDSE